MTPAAPAGGRSPDPPLGGSNLLLLTLALLVLSPVTVVTWLAGAALLRIVRLRPGWLVGTGAAAAAIATAVVGPRAAIAEHLALLEGAARWWLTGGLGSRPLHLPWVAGLLRMVPLGAPLGVVLAGAGAMRAGQAALPDPPRAARRRELAARRQVTIARRRAERASNQGGKPEAAPLAVSLGGDLDGWRRGRYLVMPEASARRARLVLGLPGGGKSVYLLREAYLAGLAGRRLIVLDGKGERPFAQGIVGAYLAGRPGASIHLFPDEALNGWTGGPQAQVNRLMGLWPWSLEADYYRENTLMALRLACDAPGAPVASMRELIAQLDPAELKRLWNDGEHLAEVALVKELDRHLGSVQVRVGNLAAAVGRSLDGTRALGDADLTVVSVASMALAGDADALFRLTLADLAHWTAARKDPAERALVIVDEFSAIAGGRPQAIHLVERGRSAGVPVVLAAQSRRSLGSEEEAERIIGAAGGGIVLFASSEPDDVLRLAGTVRTLEHSWQVAAGQVTDRGTRTERSKGKVDANRVRGFGEGQAVIIAGGRAEECIILQPPAPARTPPALEAPSHD